MRCYSHLSDDEREQIGLEAARPGRDRATGRITNNFGLPKPYDFA
jgi:hypothetical protein